MDGMIIPALQSFRALAEVDGRPSFGLIDPLVKASGAAGLDVFHMPMLVPLSSMYFAWMVGLEAPFTAFAAVIGTALYERHRNRTSHHRPGQPAV